MILWLTSHGALDLNANKQQETTLLKILQATRVQKSSNKMQNVLKIDARTREGHESSAQVCSGEDSGIWKVENFDVSFSYNVLEAYE